MVSILPTVSLFLVQCLLFRYEFLSHINIVWNSASSFFNVFRRAVGDSPNSGLVQLTSRDPARKIIRRRYLETITKRGSSWETRLHRIADPGQKNIPANREPSRSAFARS